MKISLEILNGLIDRFVPKDNQAEALKWTLAELARQRNWGGARTGAGAKQGNKNAIKKTRPAESAPVPATVPAEPETPTLDENTKFLAGRQGWVFPTPIRKIAEKYYTPAQIRNIEIEFSCQEWESEMTVAKLLEQFAPSVPTVQQVDPREQMFDEFWTSYPSKGKTEKKKAKQKYYNILKNREAKHDEIMTALDLYKKTDRVNNGYIKGAYSWLLNEMWKTDWTIVGMDKKTDRNMDRANGLMDLMRKYEN